MTTTTLNDSYEMLYKHAYRISQDSATGTSILPGRPEARYEAYARAYAGCCHAIPKNLTNTTARTDKKNNNENDNKNNNDDKNNKENDNKKNNSTTMSFWSFQNKYRRSYARLYEATVCQSISRDDVYVLSNDSKVNRMSTRKQKFVGTRKQNSEAATITKHAKDSDASDSDSHKKERQRTSSNMNGNNDVQLSQPCGGCEYHDIRRYKVKPRSYRDVVVSGQG